MKEFKRFPKMWIYRREVTKKCKRMYARHYRRTEKHKLKKEIDK